MLSFALASIGAGAGLAGCGGVAATPPALREPPTTRLDHLVMNVLAPDAVLHGWGQSESRFATRGSEYFTDVVPPALVSDYLSLRGLRADPSGAARALQGMGGWTGANGATFDFVIMECVTHELTPRDLLAAVRAAGIDVPSFEDEQALEAFLRQVLADPTVRAAVRQHLVFSDQQIARGDWDDEIAAVARAIASVDGPVLLRLMQEFLDGQHSDDVRDPEAFRQAWRRFVDIVRDNGATNAEFVWHPNGGSREDLTAWWPGDDYVDWVATSIFRQDQYAEKREHNAFARERGKPFMVAESAPTLGVYSEAGIRTDGVWESWFVPYFAFVSDPNVKAFFYININWPEDSAFPWPDSRVQSNPAVLGRYLAELSHPRYLHSRDLSARLGSDE